WDQINRGLSSGRAANVLQIRRRIHGRNRNNASITRKALAPREPSIHGSRTMANGMDADARLAVRQARSRPLVVELHTWLLEERARMSKHNSVAKAIDYLMPPKGERWSAFTAFLDDGRICLTNNAAERALRGIALGRKSWLFAGSERGGERAAFMYSLIVSCKMNDIDPQAWMADVLARMPDITVSRLPELLPWNWKAQQETVKAA
ncbi:MAG: IS66 family transposase, partial [Roseinatronobacter sp.]